MSAIDLTRDVQYRKFKLDGRDAMFHSSVAYTTKREADRAANESRKLWDQPARVVRGKHGWYYLYIHGED